MAISPNKNKYLVSGSEDETFIVWERMSQEQGISNKNSNRNTGMV